jgi:hypothetical protein
MYKIRTTVIILSFLYLFDSISSQANKPNYQVVESNEVPELQKLINISLYNISQTQVGKDIVQFILDCQAKAVKLHLGVDYETSLKIVKFCTGNKKSSQSQPTSEFVKSSPLKSLKKIVGSSQVVIPKKSYSVIYTDNKDWAIDSWTSSFQNNTSIVIPRTTLNEPIDINRLTEILAHETAIYFDSKFWVGSTEFSNLPESDLFFSKFKKSRALVSLALDNPLIAHTFAFLRAFKIEQNIMNELEKNGIVYYSGQESERRRAKIQSILNCKSKCLEQFISNNVEQNINLALPLIYHSPSYRVRLINAINNDLLILSPDQNKNSQERKIEFSELLSHLPVKFFEAHAKLNILLLLEILESSNNESSHEAETLANFNSFFLKDILPLHYNDLGLLKAESTNIHALEYLTFPLLSGYNTRMSSGPRPRIVVGGF